jgi:cytochrome c-type biogenesis protein CcmH
MPTTLWIASIAMTIVAVLIIARPLIARGQHKLLYATIAGVPLFAFAVYLTIGSPGQVSASSPGESMRVSSGNTMMSGEVQDPDDVGSVASLLAGLEARLEENPDDSDGWLLLAKSYNYLGRTDEAIDAYDRAVALGQFDETLDALANGGTADDVTDSGSGTAAVVSGVVSLSDRAAEIVEPTDTLFIFARAPGQAGPPAAVVQQSAGDLPVEFRLTDAQSMVAGNALSNFDTVVVTARISRGGNAANALQGLEAQSGPVAVTGGEPVKLVVE